MKKSMKVFIITVSLVVSLAALAAAGLSVMTYLKVNAMEAAQETEPLGEGIAGEDDVTIGGEYVIRSTKHISDAYLSGDSSALSEKDKETLDMAAKVLSEIITDGMSDYEKEQAVFLWMNSTLKGDAEVTVLVRGDTSSDNPHGVLSSHTAVCVGYATTFRLFMQMLDIPCRVVHDTAMVHSWDLVQLGGHWYHVDLLSADVNGDPLQTLNMNDSLRSALGYSWDIGAFPACDSLEYCYAYRSAQKADDIYAIPAAVKKAVDGGLSFLSLTIPAEESGYDLLEQMMASLESRLMGSAEYQNYYFTHAASPADGGLFLYIGINNCGELPDDGGKTTDDEQEKIDKAISDSFGELTDPDYDGIYDFGEG